MNQNNDNQSIIESVLCALNNEKILECKDLFEKEGLKSFLNDQELKNTMNALFENNLNVCKTSKKTFMHRNTLLYRIEKIKKMTSFDARVFEDAVSLKTLLVLYEIYSKY